KVKRSENGVIVDPITLPPNATIATARQIMRTFNVSGIPIVEGEGDGSERLVRRPMHGAAHPRPKILGILTRRDLKFQEDETRRAARGTVAPIGGRTSWASSTASTLRSLMMWPPA